MKKLISLIFVIVLLIPQTVALADTTKSFPDVPKYKWFYEPVMTLTNEYNCINGYDDGNFKPNENIAINEFIKMVVSAVATNDDISQYRSNEYKNSWDFPYIQYALDNGIMETPDGKYSSISKGDLSIYITRGDMAIYLKRALNLILGEDLITDSEELLKIKATLRDSQKFSSMSDEDGEEILQAMGLGLISGYSDHSLKPNNFATRGEACTMVLRLLEKDKRIYTDVNTPYVTTDIIKTGYDLASLLPNYPDFVNNFNGRKYVLLENGNRFSFKFLHSHQNANTISNPNSPRGYSYYFSYDNDSGYLWALCNG